MHRRTDFLLVAALLGLPVVADAQPSTSKVARVWEFEGSLGAELAGDSLAGNVFVAQGAARRTLGDPVALRLSALAIRRVADRAGAFDGSHPGSRTIHELAGVAAEVELRATGDGTIFLAAGTGFGFAPLARSHGPLWGPGGLPSPPNQSATFWSGYVALTARRVVVRQYFIALLHAPSIFEFREYYPTMIGLRF